MKLLQKHFDTALESPDGIKKLRELILTLAMQGKLVPQDPKDQPASELLKEIKEEKERISREAAKARSKDKELPPIKPEEVPYPVPEGWVWTRLGEIGEINPRNIFNDNKDAGFVPMPKIFAEYGLKHQFEVKKWGEIKKGYTHFADGDIGLAKITPCFENAKSCVFDGLPNKIGAGTTELHIFRNAYSAIYPQFLLLYIKNPKYISEGQKRMTGSAGQKRVPTSYFADNPFPLPPLAEQKRIVTKIDELMLLCDKLETQRKERKEKILTVHRAALNQILNTHSIPPSSSAPPRDNSSIQFLFSNFSPLYSVKENVAELKKAILTLAMQGKLVKQDPKDQPASELVKEIKAEKERISREGAKARSGDIELPPIKPEEIPYPVPEGWVWVIFGDIAIIERGGSPRPIELFLTEDQRGLNWIKIGDTDKGGKYITSTKEKIKPEGLVKTRMVYPGDFLLTNSMSYGRPYITKIEGCIHDGWLRIAPQISLDKDFLYNFLSSGYIANVFSKAASGAVVQNLNSAKVRELLIPIPPLSEQKRIVAKIDELMALCNKLEEQIDNTTTKQTALFDAVLAVI